MPDDHHDILQLSARYALALDGGDDDAWRALFTPDFVMRGTSAGDRSLSDIASLPSVQLARYRKTFHLVGTQRVICEGSEGHGTVYCSAHHYAEVTHVGGRMPLDIAYVLDIVYEDRYRKTGAIWQFSERRLNLVSRRIYQCATPDATSPPGLAAPPDLA